MAESFYKETYSIESMNTYCKITLLQALADDHTDREVWLNSFYNEKDSIESMNTYRKITPDEYHALRKKGAPPLPLRDPNHVCSDH